MGSSSWTFDRENYRSLVEGLLEQLNMGRSFGELFDSIYERFRGVIPYHRIGVALLEPEDHLRLAFCRSDGELVLKVGYAAGITGSSLEALLRTGEPRVLNDLDAYLARHPQSVPTQLIVQEGMKSSLTLPLLVDGRPLGVVFFSSRERGVYSREHGILLKRLAGHIAISLEKARLVAELRRRNEEMAEANKTKDQFLELLTQEVDRRTAELRASEQRYRSLVELGRVTNSSLELQQVVQCAAEQLHAITGCDQVSLLLVDRQDNTHHGFGMEFPDVASPPPRVARSRRGEQSGRAPEKTPPSIRARRAEATSQDPDDRRALEIPPRALEGSAVQWVIEQRVPRIARSLGDERLFPEDTLFFDGGFHSYAYVPLICHDACVGVIGLASRREEEPDRWDFGLLHEFCAQLATAVDNASAYAEIDRLKSQLEEQNIYLRGEIETQHDVGHIIGTSQAMQRVRQAIHQVAATDSTVLILGETGTGKELIARAIHDHSARKKNLLVKVNCAAFGAGVITSELFGHEAGAFTGAARQRQGRFEVAQHGSIFLDEISDVPLDIQVMLLRVLQERVIERVGGNQPINIDVRVIAATNRDLKQLADQKQFREDLFYRLNVFPLHIPPLRERRDDIPALINHFINRFTLQMDKRISRVNRQAMECLMEYDWPGNVRELENVVERGMIVSRGDTLDIDPHWLAAPGDHNPTTASPPPRSLAEIQRRAILETLRSSGGKVYGPGGAAERLDVKPQTLYSKMRKLGIKKHSRFEGPADA